MDFSFNTYSFFFFSSFHFGCNQIAKNITKRKELLGPISLDNNEIIQDWVVEEKNLLDKVDFNMDCETIEKLLITFSKIINDEEDIFYEDNEITILSNESQ